jgi:hypothetical protein
MELIYIHARTLKQGLYVVSMGRKLTELLDGMKSIILYYIRNKAYPLKVRGIRIPQKAAQHR